MKRLEFTTAFGDIFVGTFLRFERYTINILNGSVIVIVIILSLGVRSLYKFIPEYPELYVD
uniref:Uncharacterized protein n=1 Tax=Glossina palpalis gambiensis TaxID=67801 RepID=A0A1B0C6C3_9MUSC